jgi:hypothetical protein
VVVTTVDCAIAPVEIIATIAVVSRSLFMLFSSPPYAACENPRMVARFRNKGNEVAYFSRRMQPPLLNSHRALEHSRRAYRFAQVAAAHVQSKQAFI